MTISELGSLGELIGSIAVLVTLIYLAVQTRMARLQSAAIATRERANAMRDLLLVELSDEILSNAVVKATGAFDGMSFDRVHPFLLDAGLSELEAHKLQQFYATMLHIYMTQHLLGDSDQRAVTDGGIKLNFTTSVGRKIWEAGLRTRYAALSPEFADHVDALIAARAEEAHDSRAR